MPRTTTAPTEDEALGELYATLDALRRSDDPFAPSHDLRWRWLSAWVRARSHPYARGGRRDDVEQETLLAIARHVHAMDATTPLQAAKWVSIILKRKHIDTVRGDAIDPVTTGLAPGSEDVLLERLPAAEPNPVTPDALAEHHARIEQVVLAHVERSEARPLSRVMPRAQARAALYRLVLDLDSEGVESRLRLPEPVGKDRLYKWIERGRGIVAEAMRGWAESQPDDDQIGAVAAVVIELVEDRRADAGKPRPSRRRG